MAVTPAAPALHRRVSSLLPDIAVFAFAVGVRAVAAVHYLPSHDVLLYGGGDGLGYHQLAVDVSHGDFFTAPLYIARPPGLPLILGAFYWIFGTSSTLFVGLSVVATSLVAVVAMRLSRWLGFTERRALVVGSIVAIEPTAVFVGISPLADSLFALAVTTAVLFLVGMRARPDSRLMLAGLCASLIVAVMTKPRRFCSGRFRASCSSPGNAAARQFWSASSCSYQLPLGPRGTTPKRTSRRTAR